MNAARLEKASYGGFYATGNLEPVACALKDDNMNDKNHSVDGYMSVVQGRDGTACWEDHVLLVVDGLPHGPGDVAGLNDLDNPGQSIDCSAAACIYDPVANPNLSGCHCPPVNRARALAAKGINVHVIAATTDLSTRNSYAAATLNNIARAGSTDPTFINIPRYAASEDELKQILKDANERVARQHFAISLLKPMQYSLHQPWFKGYHGQFGSVCSPAGSPQLLFFYPARFWIDHDLKKKMGH
jgi:hypothetical protein